MAEATERQLAQLTAGFGERSAPASLNEGLFKTRCVTRCLNKSVFKARQPLNNQMFKAAVPMNNMSRQL